MILTGETRLKVKIFDFEHENDLEKAINEFIKSKKIIDIKYQIEHNPPQMPISLPHKLLEYMELS